MPLSLRAWGLITNFVANALPLFGLYRVLKNEDGDWELWLGVILTVFIIFILAKPPRD